MPPDGRQLSRVLTPAPQPARIPSVPLPVLIAAYFASHYRLYRFHSYAV